MIFRGIHRSDRPFSDPGEARTLDPMIKSHLLYQLSYGVWGATRAASVGWLPQLQCKGKCYFLYDKNFGDFFEDLSTALSFKNVLYFRKACYFIAGKV